MNRQQPHWSVKVNINFNVHSQVLKYFCLASQITFFYQLNLYSLTHYLPPPPPDQQYTLWTTLTISPCRQIPKHTCSPPPPSCFIMLSERKNWSMCAPPNPLPMSLQSTSSVSHFATVEIFFSPVQLTYKLMCFHRCSQSYTSALDLIQYEVIG